MDMVTKDGSPLIVPGDLLATLRNCKGYYTCPCDEDGKLLGPLVGYTAEYEPGKKWVGKEYFNFSMADIYPAVLTEFAVALRQQVIQNNLEITAVVGAPWAGVKLSLTLALLMGFRHVFAEKEVVGFDETGKKKEELRLGRYEGILMPGDQVLVGEELVNNASTTGKLIGLIEETGAKVVGIGCAINRSYPFQNTFHTVDGRSLPIIAAVSRSTPQYRQDDSEIAEEIRAGNIVWKPKYNWPRLEAAMKQYGLQ